MGEVVEEIKDSDRDFFKGIFWFYSILFLILLKFL